MSCRACPPLHLLLVFGEGQILEKGQRHGEGYDARCVPLRRSRFTEGRTGLMKRDQSSVPDPNCFLLLPHHLLLTTGIRPITASAMSAADHVPSTAGTTPQQLLPTSTYPSLIPQVSSYVESSV